MSPSHREHGEDDLRSTGTALYERAPRQGRLPAEEARAAPCLVDLGPQLGFLIGRSGILDQEG
ncbi:hypothetical protein [Streptomyces luteogriseus]|uniref:hypothetical protein n=1 Tax=Streptomyces luteogriseus TaxID=68233 RepID=UPI0038131C96